MERLEEIYYVYCSLLQKINPHLTLCLQRGGILLLHAKVASMRVQERSFDEATDLHLVPSTRWEQGGKAPYGAGKGCAWSVKIGAYREES